MWNVFGEVAFSHEQAILLTEEDLEPASARGDISGKPNWMGQPPLNSTGFRSQSGPPVPPPGVEQSPMAARNPDAAVGDSVNELPKSNGPGKPHQCMLCAWVRHPMSSRIKY